MAKDGTNRGGSRAGAGRKKKPLYDKIMEGQVENPDLIVMDFGEKTSELQGKPMPKPSEFLSAQQADGTTLGADEIYKSTWNWLNDRGCTAMVSPDLIERYAMSAARWIQCEDAVTRYGFLSQHPTTGAAIASPYVTMSQNYMSQTNRLWMEIYQIVKENCTGNYAAGTTPQEDVMEKLLRTKNN